MASTYKATYWIIGFSFCIDSTLATDSILALPKKEKKKKQNSKEKSSTCASNFQIFVLTKHWGSWGLFRMHVFSNLYADLVGKVTLSYFSSLAREKTKFAYKLKDSQKSCQIFLIAPFSTDCLSWALGSLDCHFHYWSARWSFDFVLHVLRFSGGARTC